MNILYYLDIKDRPHALYHGLAAVAQDCASMPPRFELSPLPSSWLDLPDLNAGLDNLSNPVMLKQPRDVLLLPYRLGADSCPDG